MKLLRNILLLTLPVLALLGGNTAAVAASSPSTTTEAKAPAVDVNLFKTRFGKLGLQVTDVVASDIAGLLEVHTNGGVVFATPDGKQFIAGTLYGMDQNGQYVDVLAKRQAPLNAKKIAQYRNDMIEYKAKDEKYAVTVFTDITCGYCAKLHSQMKEYNDAGITVRYLAFPRQGPVGQVATQMASIWCAKDPAQAMNVAKRDHKLPEVEDNIEQCKQKVADHYQLGRELGVNGTPAIFLPNGEMIGGYIPPQQLLARLQQQ